MATSALSLPPAVRQYFDFLCSSGGDSRIHPRSHQVCGFSTCICSLWTCASSVMCGYPCLASCIHQDSTISMKIVPHEINSLNYSSVLLLIQYSLGLAHACTYHCFPVLHAEPPPPCPRAFVSAFQLLTICCNLWIAIHRHPAAAAHAQCPT